MNLTGRVETALRPRVPMGAVPALVRSRARRAVRHEGARAEARRQMTFVLGDDAPDLDAVVDRYLTLQAWRGELRWHPDTIVRQPVEGGEHLRAACTDGHGAIVSFVHHGLYDGLFPSISREGIGVAPLATPTMFDGTAKAWMMQQYRVCSIGAPAINAATGTDGILEAIRSGLPVGIATDVPSKTPITFLGRQVLGAFGTARIAHEHGIPVVLVSSHPGPDGPSGRPTARVRVAPALDPADFETPRDLLDAIVAHHETAVAAWPEAYDQPLKRWTWEPAGVDA